MQKQSPLANQCLWASLPPHLCLDVPTSGSLHLRRLPVSASLSSFLGVLTSVFPVLGLPTSVCPSLWPSPCLSLPLTVFVGLSVYLSTSGIQGPLGPVSISGSSRFSCSLSLRLLVSPGLCPCLSGQCFLPSLVYLVAMARGRVSREQG